MRRNITRNGLTGVVDMGTALMLTCSKLNGFLIFPEPDWDLDTSGEDEDEGDEDEDDYEIDEE